MDPESGDILVDDRDGAPLRVPAEAFATARGVVSPGRRRLLYLDPPPTASHDLAEAALAAIRTGHEGRTQPRIRNFGLPGLAKWADLVADPKDPKGWPTTLPDGEDLVRVLVWAFASIELNGTGRGGDRPLMAAFLDEAADITGRDGLHEAADGYRALGDAWSELAEALLPASAGPLARLRELMLERWNAFEDPAGPDLPRFLALPAEADALQREAGASGVLGDAGRLALFAELRDLIRAIHAHEVAATDAMAAAVGVGPG